MHHMLFIIISDILGHVESGETSHTCHGGKSPQINTSWKQMRLMSHLMIWVLISLTAHGSSQVSFQVLICFIIREIIACKNTYESRSKNKISSPSCAFWAWDSFMNTEILKGRSGLQVCALLSKRTTLIGPLVPCRASRPTEHCGAVSRWTYWRGSKESLISTTGNRFCWLFC